MDARQSGGDERGVEALVTTQHHAVDTRAAAGAWCDLPTRDDLKRGGEKGLGQRLCFLAAVENRWRLGAKVSCLLSHNLGIARGELRRVDKIEADDDRRAPVADVKAVPVEVFVRFEFAVVPEPPMAPRRRPRRARRAGADSARGSGGVNSCALSFQNNLWLGQPTHQKHTVTRRTRSASR